MQPVTGFTSYYLSFIVVEHILFFHGALQLLLAGLLGVLSILRVSAKVKITVTVSIRWRSMVLPKITMYACATCTDCMRIILTGCSGLAVACLIAVRDVLESNCAVGSCVYRKNHCDLQPLAWAVCNLPAVPRSIQPSTLRGTVNEYQLFRLSNNNKW